MRYLFIFKGIGPGGVIRSSDEYTPADEAEVKAGKLEVVRFQGDLYQFQFLEPKHLAWQNVKELVR